MNTQNVKLLPVDVPLVKSLLIRLMTRNEPDRAKAMLDRASLEKNLETLNLAPEAHLAFAMSVMERLQNEGRSPVFETGLMFGVALTLSARHANGKLMLKRLLFDITRQQEEEPNGPEAIEVAPGVMAEVEPLEGEEPCKP